MNLSLKEKDSLFNDSKVSFRKVLHQIISSEIDCDRMDYLQRDSYFSGVSYGKFDANWLLSNLGVYIEDKTAHLSLHERAIYTFEDFLLSRYHMFLMVYLHHKSVGYEELMGRYIKSPDCSFKVPSDIEAYIRCDDSVFYEHLRRDAAKNEWAERILRRRTYKVALEIHDSEKPIRHPEVVKLMKRLEAKGIVPLIGDSGPGLSKYARPNLGANIPVDENTIFVESHDRLNDQVSFKPLEQFTDLFKKYAAKKYIYRVFVPENVKF
jgi:HD superfamily phosphohydrolase